MPQITQQEIDDLIREKEIELENFLKSKFKTEDVSELEEYVDSISDGGYFMQY